ncbi:hypothetical protein RN001_007790 [Aquatica leii]|uniref:C2H2-type domain-containing protein n=1 Tax=Aquatica leii TaxID=1421715 RepID=A0AAN7SGZ3_9COLE|nr:hypothetical protein RN001_007790 [Aquatica leii]
MVNSGSFDSDVDRNEKDGFTQYNHIVESPQSVISMHAVSGSLCENDFPTQTADSLPVSRAIEPTATKTEYKCNMSEEIVRVGGNLQLQTSYENSSDENKCIKETYISTRSNTTQSFITDEPFVDRNINTGYLRKYKIETKPSICCSVPLDRIPNVLKKCGSIIANRTLVDSQNDKEIAKKEMCLYCDRAFLIPTMKQKHMNRFHFSKFNKLVNLRRQTTKCLYCDLDSSECNLKQLFTHLATKHSEKYFACLQCEMRFPNVQLLEKHKAMIHNIHLRLQTNSASKKSDTKIIDEKNEDYSIIRDRPSIIKTRIEYKRNTKLNFITEITSESNKPAVAPKTKRKCQSKYLHKTKTEEVSDTSPTLANIARSDDTKNKMKSKYVKDIRNKKLSVISTKVGIKHGLRITRQRSKILENAKNSRKKIPPVTASKNESSIVSSKYIPYQNSSFSFFDISYRVKKITDHSIDNLRISSLTFDDVFDKAFFNRVKCNIQENLLNYIDGKLFKSIESENRISSFQKTKDVSIEESSSNCGLSNSISTTSDVSIDSQFSEDSESQVDKSNKKKTTQTEETGNYKYFTRRKYQAVISERKGNKDLSKLDMWTQLVMKNRQQKILSDQKTDKELIEYKKSEEYKVKMQQEELNGILDKRGPLEDLKEEAMRTVALEKINSTSTQSSIDTYFDVTIILNEILNNLFPKEDNLAVSDKENYNLDDNLESSLESRPQGEEVLSMFNLQRISHSSRVNAIENVLTSEIDETAVVELTGEWARTRIYICASCGIKLPNAKLLLDHKNLYHENVWCQHYEFVGNQGELYRHLSIPGLGKIGAMEDKLGNDVWRRSDARECSKCNKRFNNLGDLHRHMLECGGDLAWMLERKKYKYRPYGSKPRKKRRGLLRLLQSFRNHPKEKRKKTIKKFNGPRQKPSDADTIQRMLANLPAKRITRKAISLKDGFPRPAVNKNILKSKVKPAKKENKTIAKKSVTTANTNINRTRRLLRSNSAILLDNKINLILPKFKRKNNENKIIRRHSLRSKTNNIHKHFLKNNPIVATCKLTDDQIKNLVKTDSINTESLNCKNNQDDDKTLDNSDHKDDKPLNELLLEEEPQKIAENEITALDNETKEVEDSVTQILDNDLTTNETNVTKPETSNYITQNKVTRKKKKKRKQKNKSAAENSQNQIVKKKINKKVTRISTINTRKMNLRNTNVSKKVKNRTNRRHFVKAKLTEIVQVDGSPHSKSACKGKPSKRELNSSHLCTQNCSVTTNSSSNTEDNDNNTMDVIPLSTANEDTDTPVTNGGEDTDTLVTNGDEDTDTPVTNGGEDTDIPVTNGTEESDTVLNNCNTSFEKTESSEVKHCDESTTETTSSSITKEITPFEDKESDDKLLIKIPPATKKGTKKTRGLNDCIAMLTNKLQDKNLDSTNNVLEGFSLKSFESSINGLLNKTTNGINNSLMLNDYYESKNDLPITVVNELNEENDMKNLNNSITKTNGCYFVHNGIHKDVEVEVIEETGKTTQDVLLNETKLNFEQCFEEFQDCRVSINIHDDYKIPEKEKPKEAEELKVNKHKVKHKRKETRKRRLFRNVSKNIVVTNDKLQEIQDKTNDANTILNATKNTSDFNNSANEDTFKQSSDNNSNDLEKFSNSEKENSFNHTIIKIIKPRKSKKKVEKEVVLNVEVDKLEVPLPSKNHVDDIINAVATNESVDSEDELPLSELAKKYVTESKVQEEAIPTLEVVFSSKTIIDELEDVGTNNESTGNTVVELALPKDPTSKNKKTKRQKNYTKRKKQINFTSNLTNPPTTETTVGLEIENTIVEDSTSVVPGELNDKIQLPLENAPTESMCMNEEIRKHQSEESVSNVLLNNSESQENILVDVTVSNDSTSTPKIEVPIKKKRGRKPKALTLQLLDKTDDETNNVYCEICKKTFRRSENLLKHKRTLTHIAKLSELEALESKQQLVTTTEITPTVSNVEESEANDVQSSLQNIDSVACDEFPENSEASEFVAIGPSQESLQLVDIINDVLSKPVDAEYVEHRNFSNLILQSDPEIKRCKSLGERKSFDCDKLPIIDTSNTSPIPIETNISGSTADIIVEKQISLLENMIEDNRNTFKTSQKSFIASKLPITEEYSCQSNSSAFSILSSSKQEDLNEITFTHNTNIITNLIKPNLEDNLISSTQYEQISDDSNSSHLQIEEQKSRKALNRDEELFLECCSLLKSSSDVSDLCRKSVKSTKFLNNFGLKPLDELEWLEQKQLPTKSAILEHPIHNTIEVQQTNTSVCDNFYNDVSYSNIENGNLKVYLEKRDTENFFSRPPIFEDISTESDGSSRKSVPHSKVVNLASDQIAFTVKLNNDDRSSPNVESAQIPFEGDKATVEEQNNDSEHLDTVDTAATKEVPVSPSLLIKKPDNAKTIQTNIMDYVVSKKIKKNENKKFLTKGALKVFEGLKVSIPKVELDMKEVLSCSPTSKRLEIEAEQDKLQEKKISNKKEIAHRNFLFNKIIKNGKKINNKLGLKITKKRYNINAKLNKIHHDISKKTHDVYDFEETQDSVDIFIKNSNSLPDYHSFKNKITNKCGVDDFDDDLTSKSPKEDLKKLNKNSHCLPPNTLSSRKLKMNKCITKKKCMIMGRIFKNALKSKMSEDIKNIPVIDNNQIVEDFVMNCQDMQLSDKNEKSKLSEEEMNLLFDSLLNDDNSLSKCKGESTVETDLNSVNVKHTDKCKQRMNKCKKRQRGNSPDSSDEEFSIKKATKKHINKKTNVNDCVINLEQELKECIGVASRKSQRKCTSGKQNVLVEYWSSDESNLEFEQTISFDNTPQIVTKELSNDVVEVVNVIANVIEDKTESVKTPTETEENKTSSDKAKEIKPPSLKNKHFKKRKMLKPSKEVNGCLLNIEENDSETIASTRQKRNAVNTLYYWSSSSEDEMQDVIEVKSIREDCDEEDRPLQQGWIVGDSPKKLVTMLAQAKGKKLDIEYVKKNRKKRTSV